MKDHMRVKAVISLDAIAANFEAMHRTLQPGTKMVAVIKADGYGHGAVRIARLVEQYDYIWGFAAATAEEALILRHADIRKPILILGHVFAEELGELIQEDIRLTVSSFDQAEEIAKAGKGCRPIHIHLALDTGMSRIGFADKPESVRSIAAISCLDNIEIEGIFTHFARADETEITPARIQLERYLNFISLLEREGITIPLHHVSNSAGIMRMREANLSMVRAGITIYGIYPSDEVERELLTLQPAMSLYSHVSFVKKIEAGTQVSYGGTWTAEKETCLATIPVGYADGYPRLLSGKGYVLIRGQKAPIRGRVCMDQFMVDVTGIDGVTVGDKVTLLGQDGAQTISVDTLSSLSGRFPYEFVCDISPRVPRVYLTDGREE